MEWRGGYAAVGILGRRRVVGGCGSPFPVQQARGAAGGTPRSGTGVEHIHSHTHESLPRCSVCLVWSLARRGRCLPPLLTSSAGLAHGDARRPRGCTVIASLVCLVCVVAVSGLLGRAYPPLVLLLLAKRVVPPVTSRPPTYVAYPPSPCRTLRVFLSVHFCCPAERLRALSVKMSAVGMKGHHDARSPASDVDAVGSYRASSDTDDEGHCADLPRRPRVARSATCRAYESSDMDDDSDGEGVGGGARGSASASSASLSDDPEPRRGGAKKGKPTADGSKASKARSSPSSTHSTSGRADASGEAEAKPAGGGGGGGGLRGFFAKRGADAAAPVAAAVAATAAASAAGGDKVQARRKNSGKAGASESKDRAGEDKGKKGAGLGADKKSSKKTAPDLTLMTVEEMQAESLALTKEVAKLRRKADRTDAEDARMAEARDRLESLADRILDGDGQGSADSGATPRHMASSASSSSSDAGGGRGGGGGGKRKQVRTKAGGGKSSSASKPSTTARGSAPVDGDSSDGAEETDEFALDLDDADDNDDDSGRIVPPKTRRMGLPLPSRKNLSEEKEEDAAPPPTFRFLMRLKKGAAVAAAEARATATATKSGGGEDTNGAPPKSIFGRMMHKKKATPGGSSRRSASSKAADSDSEDDASLAGDDDKSSSRGGSKKSGVKGGRAKKGSPGSGSKADGSGSSVTASPTQSPSARLGKAGSPPSKSASNSSLTAADARAGRKAKKAAAEEAAKVKAGAGRVGDAMGSAKERMARRGEKLAAMDANASTMKDESSAMAVAARALRAKQEKSDKRGGFF